MKLDALFYQAPLWLCKMTKNISLKNGHIFSTHSEDEHYSLSRKTMNTRENFWNVYCFATNQMLDETAKDNRQTAAWISHDLIRNNKLAFPSATNLQFYRFRILKLFFLYFSLYMQGIDMNDV